MGAERERVLFPLRYGVVLAGLLLGECAFVFAVIFGLLNHAWAVVAICGLLAVVHAGYIVFLLKIGRKGWRGRLARL
jgi:hypothetical protein